MTSDKREKAIKYLTEEIRSLRMEPQINGCGPENWAEQMEVMESCMEAVMAYHIGEATDMIPLTLEQLRKMDGQPVWCKSLINGESEWAIIRIVEMSKTWFIALAGASQGFGDKDTYGKTWLAHAYPPAHIDREAWVSVDDRLPEAPGEYLVVYHPCYWDSVRPERRVGMDTFRGKTAWAKKKYQRVTHWMPLLEPPGSCPPEGEGGNQ